MNLKILTFRTDLNDPDFKITHIQIKKRDYFISYFLFVRHLKILTLGSSLSLKGEDKHVQQPGHRCT